MLLDSVDRNQRKKSTSKGNKLVEILTQLSQRQWSMLFSQEAPLTKEEVELTSSRRPSQFKGLALLIYIKKIHNLLCRWIFNWIRRTWTKLTLTCLPPCRSHRRKTIVIFDYKTCLKAPRHHSTLVWAILISSLARTSTLLLMCACQLGPMKVASIHRLLKKWCQLESKNTTIA
jgi:hypothetical protein